MTEGRQATVRRSDEVASLLLERVTSGSLRAGDRLPPERELAADLGVSRTVIREAVSILSGKGVLLSLVGSGLRITAVDSSRATESLGLFLAGSDFDYRDIHEVRELVEVQVAGRAATRATKQHHADMAQHCDTMADPNADPSERAVADLEFHRALAAASGNEIYSVILDSLHQGLIDVRRHNLMSKSALVEAVSSHRAILKAVRDQDESAARAAMAAHLAGVLRYWLDR